MLFALIRCISCPLPSLYLMILQNLVIRSTYSFCDCPESFTCTWCVFPFLSNLFATESCSIPYPLSLFHFYANKISLDAYLGTWYFQTICHENIVLQQSLLYLLGTEKGGLARFILHSLLLVKCTLRFIYFVFTFK